MPGEMTSWADEIDETDTSLILPPPSEKWVGNQKITTEYSHNDDGKKVSHLSVTSHDSSTEKFGNYICLWLMLL